MILEYESGIFRVSRFTQNGPSDDSLHGFTSAMVQVLDLGDSDRTDRWNTKYIHEHHGPGPFFLVLAEECHARSTRSTEKTKK